MIPLSFIWEILLILIAVIFAEFQLVGRIISVGSWMINIGVVTQPQIYIVEITPGSPSTATLALPSAFEATIVFLFVIGAYWSMAQVFQFWGRDIVGRKVE